MRSRIDTQAQARTADELTRGCISQLFGQAMTVVLVATLMNAISYWFFCFARTVACGRPGLGQCETSVGGFAALTLEPRRVVTTMRLV